MAERVRRSIMDCVLSGFLAAVLSVAGCLKLINPSADVLPGGLRTVWHLGSGAHFSVLVGALEVGLGLLVLVGWWRGWVAWLITGVSAGFCALHLWLALSGAGAAECGCFGDSVRIHNLALISLSSLMVLAGYLLATTPASATREVVAK